MFFKIQCGGMNLFNIGHLLSTKINSYFEIQGFLNVFSSVRSTSSKNADYSWRKGGRRGLQRDLELLGHEDLSLRSEILEIKQLVIWD